MTRNNDGALEAVAKHGASSMWASCSVYRSLPLYSHPQPRIRSQLGQHCVFFRFERQFHPHGLQRNGHRITAGAEIGNKPARSVPVAGIPVNRPECIDNFDLYICGNCSATGTQNCFLGNEPLASANSNTIMNSYRPLEITVIPAKAGIQRFETCCKADKPKTLPHLRGYF